MMLHTKTEQTDEFTVVDETGNAYKVIELTEMVESHPLNQPAQLLPGIRTLHLSDGTPLQDLKNGEYEDLKNGRKFRKAA